MIAGDKIFIAYASPDMRIMAAVYPATVLNVDGEQVVARSTPGGVVHTTAPKICGAFVTEVDAWRWCEEQFRRLAHDMLSEAVRCGVAAAGVAAPSEAA